MLDHGNLRVPSGVHVPSPGGPAAGSSGLPASTPLSCIRPTGTGGMIVSPSSLVPHYPPITSYTSMQPHSKVFPGFLYKILLVGGGGERERDLCPELLGFFHLLIIYYCLGQTTYYLE